METNLPVIIVAALVAMCLVVWLVYRNLKDKEELEQDMDRPVQRPHRAEDEEVM